MGLQFLRPQLPTAGLHGGGSDTEQESEHKVKPGEENSLAAPAGIRTRDLSITSPREQRHPALPVCVMFECSPG